jgi:hypothetical protein
LQIAAIAAVAAFFRQSRGASLADLGFLPAAMMPTQFCKFGADEAEKWANVVKFAGQEPAHGR